MNSKISLFALIAAIGIFCCGCTSLIAEENPASEVNEEVIESESPKETNHNQQVSYEEYSGNRTTGGITYNSAFLDGGTAFSATINGNNLRGSFYSVQEITQQIAEIDDIAGVIENGVCRYEFQDDGQGDRGTLYIKFSEDRIEIISYGNFMSRNLEDSRAVASVFISNGIIIFVISIAFVVRHFYFALFEDNSLHSTYVPGTITYYEQINPFMYREVTRPAE